MECNFNTNVFRFLYFKTGDVMGKPIIADVKPQMVKLEKDKKYFFCTCGRSKKGTFCDGSHAGTGLTPKAFIAPADMNAAICMCKHTQDPPFCDGTHAKFSKDQVGSEGPG